MCSHCGRAEWVARPPAADPPYELPQGPAESTSPESEKQTGSVPAIPAAPERPPTSNPIPVFARPCGSSNPAPGPTASSNRRYSSTDAQGGSETSPMPTTTNPPTPSSKAKPRTAGPSNRPRPRQSRYQAPGWSCRPAQPAGTGRAPDAEDSTPPSGSQPIQGIQTPKGHSNTESSQREGIVPRQP